MRGRFGLCVVLFIQLLTTAGSAWARRHEGSGSPLLTVYIHNFSELPQSTVEAATSDAEAIFHRAGLSVRVVIDPLVMRDGELKPATRFEQNATTLTTNILTREMAARLPMGKDALGVAPGAELKNRNVAYVFAHRVTELSRLTVRTVRDGGPAWMATESRILAFALAHEVAHLLLNTAGHPNKGIMRGNWRFSELQAMAAMNLTFLKDEVAHLQQAEQQRVKLAAEPTVEQQ